MRGAVLTLAAGALLAVGCGIVAYSSSDLSNGGSPPPSDPTGPTDAADAARDPGDGTSDGEVNGRCGVCVSGTCRAGVTAAFDAAPSGWSLLGAAAFDPATASLRLAEAAEGQAGAAVYESSVVGPLDVRFSFRIGRGTSGDGLAFFMKEDAVTVQGVCGGGLCVAGLRGVGVEIDTHDNGPLNLDVPGEHLGLDDLARVDGGNAPTSLVTVQLAKSVRDEAWHVLEVRIAENAAQVRLDGTLLVTASSPWRPSARYFVGVAASNGGTYDRYDIKDFTMTLATPQCL